MCFVLLLFVMLCSADIPERPAFFLILSSKENGRGVTLGRGVVGGENWRNGGRRNCGREEMYARVIQNKIKIK